MGGGEEKGENVKVGKETIKTEGKEEEEERKKAAKKVPRRKVKTEKM